MSKYALYYIPVPVIQICYFDTLEKEKKIEPKLQVFRKSCYFGNGYYFEINPLMPDGSKMVANI